MTIRDKVEGERIIPLTPHVASLLDALPRRNQWVFSSPASKSGRLQEPRNLHNKALVTAGLPALSLHGLRRSFGTLSEWVECPVGISAQIMGHKPSATAEKHYRVRPIDLLRMWHTKLERWIHEQADIEQEVVYTGDDIEIGFNVNYMLDVLNVTNSDMVKASLKDSNSSFLLTYPDQTDCKYVIMPMRL